MPTDDGHPDLERAIEALRDALSRHDDPDPDPDEQRLLAWVDGRLEPDLAADVERLLESSPTLRACLVELRRPVRDDALRRAVDTALDLTRPPVEPGLIDPFAPAAPAFSLEGPYGGLQAAMDAAGPSTRFGPTSRFELILRGGAGVACAVGPDGRIRCLPDAVVAVAGDARRIAGPVAALFPEPGRWQVGFATGPDPRALDGHPVDAVPAEHLRLVAIDVVEG